MLTKYLSISSMLVLFALCSCHALEDWDNDPQGNFDALWTVVDEHYCFFEEKDVDWNEVRTRYQSRIYKEMSPQMLFACLSDMLAELKDGHVNMSSGFNTYYYTNWWSDYPQNYDNRLVEQYYLGFDCRRLGTVSYAILEEGIGYISWPTFATGLGHGNIDNMLNYFSVCNGIIIDMRDNGGGDLTNAQAFIEHFLTERMLVGYMINKTGPGHNDFSKPYPYYYNPVKDGHVVWTKPVVILTNRSTFSAANNFVSIMQYLPNVTIVGARTGGGSGMPLNQELPNGWNVRMSAVSILDAQGKTTETGIEPAVKVDLDPLLALQGTDTMIDAAISILKTPTP